MDIIKVAIGAALIIAGTGSYRGGPLGMVLSIVLVLAGIKILLDGIGRGINI
jgi:hypothetical protein